MNRNAYRLAVGTLFAGGIWLGLALTTDDQAHADTPPPAVTTQQPGGLLGDAVKLPDKAAARARAVVAKVTAEPTPEPSAPAEPDPCEDQPAEPEPSKPAEPEPDPATEPEPAPSDEPTDPPVEDRPRSEPTPPVEAPPVEAPPADEPPVEAPPVEVPVPVELPAPPPVEAPQLPAPPPVPAPTPTPTPVPTPDPVPPVVDAPEPLPTDGGTAPKPQDPPPPAPAPVVAPVTLPVIGPVPAAEPPAGNVVGQLIAELTAGETAQTIPCDEPTTTRQPHDGRTQRDNADRQPGKPTPTITDSNPCRPHLPAVNTTGAGQVKPPPPTAADLIVAIFTGSHVPPVLGRLEHTRARSHLPAGRSTHIEPSPA